MAAGNFDFICEQGATFDRRIFWSDSEGTPAPLGGYTARMHIRTSLTATPPTLALTTENGGITLEETAEGEIRIHIPASVTRTLPAGTSRSGQKYVYDLELEDADGWVTRLLQGSFRVRPEVTREHIVEVTP